MTASCWKGTPGFIASAVIPITHALPDGPETDFFAVVDVPEFPSADSFPQRTAAQPKRGTGRRFR